MLKNIGTCCVLLLALSITARSAKFPTGRCTVPYNEDQGEGLQIDKKCGLTGDSPKNSAEAKQNPFKNNLCATGKPAIITTEDIDDLQRAVIKSGLSFGNSHGGKGPPKDRSPLQSLPGVHLKEGDIVTYAGFLVEAHYMPKSQGKSSSGESCNCHQNKHEMADIHLALSDHSMDFPKGEPKERRQAKMCETISAEMTPHLRPDVWSGDNLNQVIRLGRPVRITGQLFFDGSHEACEDGVPKPGDPLRRSVWEIHPIYRFEVCRHDDIAHCDVSKSADWQPISKVADIDTGDEEKDQ